MSLLPVQPVLHAGAPFREVFAEHAPYVWRALRRLGASEADADDLCQEVFVVVHRKLPEFEGRSSLRTWLYGICVRTARDHRRRAHVRNETPTDEPPDGRISAPQDAELDRAGARARLDAELSALEPEKREVFVLYEIEELTMADVAEAVGIPLQTAYSRLYSARKQLAERLADRRPS